MILKTLEKIITDQAIGIVVVPYWITQPWFPIFKKMLVKQPIIFESCENLLVLQNSRDPHPLHRSLRLIAVQLSGKHS